jgi:acetyltransferase-like isoleucine patch superfamily enzyme
VLNLHLMRTPIIYILSAHASRILLTIYFAITRFIYTRLGSSRIHHGSGLRVNAYSSFGQGTIVGSDCHFNGIRVLGYGTLTIGNHFHSGPEILVITSSHNYKSLNYLPYDNTELIKNVVIGDYVWLGARVTILPGAFLGDGVIVQAGSVVHGSIPACSIVGGNPAVVIGHRDVKVFEQLRLLQRSI